MIENVHHASGAEHGNVLVARRCVNRRAKGPLDAMGRYVPRSELDSWMASARVHQSRQLRLRADRLPRRLVREL